jgi:hypothetical protein
MRKWSRRLLVRACCGASLAAGAACDNWPVQHDGGSGGSADPGDRTVSTQCVRYMPLLSSAPRENSALCFGFANGASSALGCVENVAGGVVECVDAASGLRYVVRWSSSIATVYTTFVTEPIGTLEELGANRYEVLVVNGNEGVCELAQSPARADFCLYESR